MLNTTARYRSQLPQLGNKMFITDGGLETTLVFHHDIDLPLFAAFPLVNTDQGVRLLDDYMQSYINIARERGVGMVLDTPTWRASSGWGEQLGYTDLDMKYFNQASVSLLQRIRERHATDDTPMVINGAIGPEDDGYNPSRRMSITEATHYHRPQVETFAASAADMVTAVTMTYVEEAIGICNAATRAGIPAAISFTVETDGRLPSGISLEQAIRRTDALSDQPPVYYMINCAHPSHFDHVLIDQDDWTHRIFGVRANASCKSHAELDAATELDDGDPISFGAAYVDLRSKLPNLNVVGGCCGTDHRHVYEACKCLSASGI